MSCPWVLRSSGDRLPRDEKAETSSFAAFCLEPKKIPRLKQQRGTSSSFR
jgi:hypothetical protein